MIKIGETHILTRGYDNQFWGRTSYGGVDVNTTEAVKRLVEAAANSAFARDDAERREYSAPLIDALAPFMEGEQT